MPKTLYLLFENALGFALFQRIESDEIGMGLKDVERSVTDFKRFSKMVKMVAFTPFQSAENGLDNITNISEGLVTDYLKNFLESNLPQVKKLKNAKFQIGVDDHKIGSAVQELLNFPCLSSDLIRELLRGVRTHFPKLVKGLQSGDVEKAQLGLGHRYSQHRVKYNINREDNMVIQSICLLDQLDKDLNTFAMRVREWYSWHFPELANIIKDNIIFSRVAQFIGLRSSLTEERLDALTEITLDSKLSHSILTAARTSMGTDISDIDIINIERFAMRVLSLAKYRQDLHQYLVSKMHLCAPNLSAVIGEALGARLISHAGSLINLAKYPASTVQILGAEKALFRALKTRSNTPKYGLIFHSSFISRSNTKNKGRISRYLANKCSMASRIDSFSDNPNSIYGEKLHNQIEERMKFYENGKLPTKNIIVMREANKEAKAKLIADKKKAEKLALKLEKKNKKVKKLEKKRIKERKKEEKKKRKLSDIDQDKKLKKHKKMKTKTKKSKN